MESVEEICKIIEEQEAWLYGKPQFANVVKYYRGIGLTPIQQVLRVLPLATLTLLIKEKALKEYCKNIRTAFPKVIAVEYLYLISLPTRPEKAMILTTFTTPPEGIEYWDSIKTKLKDLQ